MKSRNPALQSISLLNLLSTSTLSLFENLHIRVVQVAHKRRYFFPDHHVLSISQFERTFQLQSTMKMLKVIVAVALAEACLLIQSEAYPNPSVMSSHTQNGEGSIPMQEQQQNPSRFGQLLGKTPFGHLHSIETENPRDLTSRDAHFMLDNGMNQLRERIKAKVCRCGFEGTDFGYLKPCDPAVVNHDWKKNGNDKPQIMEIIEPLPVPLP